MQGRRDAKLCDFDCLLRSLGLDQASEEVDEDDAEGEGQDVDDQEGKGPPVQVEHHRPTGEGKNLTPVIY